MHDKSGWVMDMIGTLCVDMTAFHVQAIQSQVLSGQLWLACSHRHHACMPAQSQMHCHDLGMAAV